VHSRLKDTWAKTSRQRRAKQHSSRLPKQSIFRFAQEAQIFMRIAQSPTAYLKNCGETTTWTCLQRHSRLLISPFFKFWISKSREKGWSTSSFVQRQLAKNASPKIERAQYLHRLI